MKKALSLLICLLSFMVVFTACSGGGSKTNTTNNSGTGGGNTQINDTQQGAQTSITTRNIADDVIGSFGLTNLVGSSSVENSSKSISVLGKMKRKILLTQRKRLLRATVISENCQNPGGTQVYDDLNDNNDNTFKITYTNCRLTIDMDDDGVEDNVEINGVKENACSDLDCTTKTIAYGENNQPYEEIYYSDSSFTDTDKIAEFVALCVLSQSGSDDGISYTVTGNGYIGNKYWVDTSSMEEQINMNDFMYIYTEDYGNGITIENYKISGSSITESYYDNTDLVSSKEISFKNFELLNRIDDSKGCNYVTIDGIYTVELTPQDSACFVGTFSIDTIEELTDDLLLEQIIDGKLKINENTTVIYDLDINDNLTMSVTVNGQTEIFNETDIAILEAFLEDSCPQLISISAR
jgi:hypothetical protein